MTTSGPVSNDLLREVIRDVVREVIREVVAEEIAAASSRQPTSALPAIRRTQAPPTRPEAHLVRGALTERHVRAVGPAGTITIGRAVVVTPLAKERARAMGVEIIRTED
jgi:hypothetical protein